MLNTYWRSVLQGSWGERKGEKNGKQPGGTLASWPLCVEIVGSSAMSGLSTSVCKLCGDSMTEMISYRRSLEEVSTPTDTSPFISWGSLIP